MTYIPPLTVSAEAINMIAEISGLIERYAIRLEQEDGLRLRKANRIITIHSSLAIEGNELSEGQVADIINGKSVIAPLRQIQEVKNAIAARTAKADSGPFIDFMLGEILKTLKDHQGTEQYDGGSNESSLDKQFGATFGKEFGVKFGIKFGDTEKPLLLLLNSNPAMSAKNLADNLGITKRAVEKQIKKLRDLQVLSRQGRAKNGLWMIKSQTDNSDMA